MIRPALILLPFIFWVSACVFVTEDPLQIENQSQSSSANLDDETIVVTGSRLPNPASGITPLTVIGHWPPINLDHVDDWGERIVRSQSSTSGIESKDISVFRAAAGSFKLCRGRYEENKTVIKGIRKRCPTRGEWRLFVGSLFSTDGERAIIVWEKMSFDKPPQETSLLGVRRGCGGWWEYAVYDTTKAKPVRLSTDRSCNSFND